MTGRCRRLIKRDATGKFSSCEPLPDRSSPLCTITGLAHPLEYAPSIGRPFLANTDRRNRACNTDRATRLPATRRSKVVTNDKNEVLECMTRLSQARQQDPGTAASLRQRLRAAVGQQRLVPYLRSLQPAAKANSEVARRRTAKSFA